MHGPRCDDGADLFILHWFKDCIYNTWDYLGFVLGLASLVTWMVAQFPQIYSNFKNKSAEALSVWFLGEWLLGDTCNLIGCLLTGNQLVTQIYTAMYFVFADVVLCLQYVYYNTLRNRRHRAQRNAQYRLLHRPSENSCWSEQPNESIEGTGNRNIQRKSRTLACLAIFAIGGHFMSSSQMGDSGLSNGLTGRVLMGADLGSKHDAEWRQYVGQIIGWVSSVLYLGSRMSQIYKNWRRQSADGLSLAMFICAITANLLYGAGILVRTYRAEDLVSSAPWLLGSLGTVFLDAIIFCQFHIYKGSSEKPGSEPEEDDQPPDEERPSHN